MRIQQSILALATLLLCPFAANADVLATYEFTDNSLAATDADMSDGITFSDVNFNSYSADQAFSAGADVVADTSLDYFSLNGIESPNGSGSAFSDGLFLSFTITNNSGNTLNFEQANIDYRGTNVFQNFQSRLFNTNTPGDIVDDTITRLGKSNGGTDADFVTDVNFIDGTGSDSGVNFDGVPITLANGSSVTFYLPFNMNSNSSTRVGDFDNIQFTGSVVPEPSTGVVLAVALFGLVGRRTKS